MSLLKTLGTAPAYLKAGFVGFEKSGKSTTATMLAVGTRKLFNLPGPIGYYDTEGGVDYVSDYIKKATGTAPVGVKSRSLKDLLDMGADCVKEGISVLVVDSITHPSDELISAYLKSVNEARAKKGLSPRKSLEMLDYAQVAAAWAPWTTFYLNSPLHIIVCGRASFEYDREENEETGKKELIKTGVKMRAAKQFGYEPSLLIEMEQIKNGDGGAKGVHIVHQATVLADRFPDSPLTGKIFNNPTFETFKPHVERLLRGTHTPVDTSIKTDLVTDDSGNVEWTRERRARTILAEEIQGLLVAHYPAQDAESKKVKAELIFKHLNTRSWTAVENLDSDRLRIALSAMKSELEPEPAQAAPPQGALFGNDGAALPLPVPENSSGTNGAAPKDPVATIGVKESEMISYMIEMASTKAALSKVQEKIKAYFSEGTITTAQYETLEKQVADKASVFTKKEKAKPKPAPVAAA